MIDKRVERGRSWVQDLKDASGARQVATQPFYGFPNLGFRLAADRNYRGNSWLEGQADIIFSGRLSSETKDSRLGFRLVHEQEGE